MSGEPELSGGFSKAIDVLDKAWEPFTRRALDGDFFWWVGTGVSMGVLPGTGYMVLGALEALQARYAGTSDVCYLEGFNAALALVGRGDVDIHRPSREWTDLDALVSALADNYPAVFECLQQYTRGKADFVLDIVRIPEVYGRDDLELDAEHTLLAALIAEGVISDLVTTNWDPLIERAYQSMSVPDDLTVVAHPDDMGPGRPRLLKMHGCARLSLQNRSKYGKYIVYTGEQVDAWATNVPQFKEALGTSLRERPVMFVGCSGRDTDIKQAVMLARERYEPFPVETPRAVFASERMTAEYEAILSRLHGDAFAGDDAARLKVQALVPLRARELLASLWAVCVAAKGRKLMQLATPALSPEWLALWDEQLGEVRLRLDERFAVESPEDRWRVVAAQLLPAFTRLTSMYLHREVPRDTATYVSLVSQNLAKMGTDDAVKQACLHLPLMALLGVIAHAGEAGWPCRIPVGADASQGQLIIGAGGIESRVFLLHHSVHDYATFIDTHDMDEDALGDCLFLFALGPMPENRREDVYRSRLPSRARADRPASLSVDDEILNPGLTFAQAMKLIADRVPVGGAA